MTAAWKTIPRRLRSALRNGVRRLLASPGELAAIAAVTALLEWAAVLRVWRLDAVGFGGDEAVYAGQAAVLADVPGMDRWFIVASRGNSNFLATQWLVSLVYRVFGVSDWGARIVSATASVLTVLLVYLLARELYGARRYALGAGLVMAVSGYSILLGRLALLDATACFFLTAAVYCLVRWMRTGRLVWAVLAAVAEAVAVQAKVTSALVVLVAMIVLAVTGLWRRMTPRRLLAVVLSGLVVSTPALYQLLTDTGGVRGYFAASTARTSEVPWFYYPKVLWDAEGILLFALLLAAVVVALVRRRRADLLPLVWLGVYAVFLQFYPLKGYNYLLPLMPPLALLAGHLIGWVASWAATRVRLGLAALLAAASALLVLSQVGAVDAAVTNDRAAGMREAALWLKAHHAEHAGAIALSHGSGQYVLPFYGGIDAYPYGRFRIATVLPGGRVVQSRAPRNGDVPLAWVDHWPARLIAQGRVRYLVYQTKPLDDPPEQSQVAGTITEKQFRSFIAHYGGRLVHAEYWDHEARVYVYRVTRRLPRPVVTASAVGAVDRHGALTSLASAARSSFQEFVIRAQGFTFGSPLKVSYGPSVVGRAVADARGSARVTVRVPVTDEPRYHLIVSDRSGTTGAVTGIAPARLSYSFVRRVVHVSASGAPLPRAVGLTHQSGTIDIARTRPDGSVSGSFRRVHVWGAGFAPHRAVALYVDGTRIGLAHARGDGSVSAVFSLAAGNPLRFKVAAVGARGRIAVAGGQVSPRLAFAAQGTTARVVGTNYSPGTKVTLTYAHRFVGLTRADHNGSFTYDLALPSWTRPDYRLAATDPLGRTATVTGLVRR